jgi:hypothetical protein
MNPRHKRPSQATQFLKHFRAGNTITSPQAWELFHFTRLSARIHEMRKAGHKIVEVGTDSNGFSIFRLEGQP